LVEHHLDRVIIRKDYVELHVWDTEGSPPRTIAVQWSASSPPRNRQIVLPQSAEPVSRQPIRSECRARLVEGISRGRYWVGQLTSGEVRDTKEIAKRERCSDRSIRMTLSLAFISPSIVKAAIDGTLQRDLGVASLNDVPADWQRQVEVIS
jgi:site-specific DNA recombinase